MSFKAKYFLFLVLIMLCNSLISQNSKYESLVNQITSIDDNNESEIRIFKIVDSLEKTRLFSSRYYFLDNLAKKYRALNKKNSEAFTLNLVGNLYVEAGYYYDAINTHKKAGLIYDSLKNYSGLNNTNTNIGNSFYYISDLGKALEYYNKALVYAFKCTPSPRMDDKISNVYNNIGTVYGSSNKFNLAKLYFKKALHIAEKHSDSASIAYAFNNLAQVYGATGKQDSSEYYYNLALTVKLRHGDIYDKIDGLNAVAHVSNSKKDTKRAIQLLNEALKLIDTTALFLPLSTTYFNLYESYKLNGDIKNEYKYYKLFNNAKDSLSNRQKSDEIRKQEVQSDFNTIRIADSLETVNQFGIRDLKIQQEKRQSYFLVLILLLTVIALGLIYSRFSTTKKQKQIIEQQKAIVDVKNKEITDSINYAKRLQNAILPPEKTVQDDFKESFIIYQPKDIVSGDFYFYEKKNDFIFIAAADCTGHGVPGAMLSITCHNVLQRAINEFALVNPGKILDLVKRIITENFNKASNSISDGMDISLLVINCKNQSIEWAGANSKLFYVQSNGLMELKADRQPVGKSDSDKEFTTHQIPYLKDTIFYLFTDGIVDQFGEENNKKFTIGKLRTLLEEIKIKNMLGQQQHITDEINKWKGRMEQTDDITILGIKV